jgi:hypothetical protein
MMAGECGGLSDVDAVIESLLAAPAAAQPPAVHAQHAHSTPVAPPATALPASPRALPSAQAIKALCEKCKELLVLEGNVRQVSSPVTIVGDVHGQFYDVLEVGGAGTFFMFVDRGVVTVRGVAFFCYVIINSKDFMHFNYIDIQDCWAMVLDFCR